MTPLSEDERQEIVAVLFHRPPKAIPSTTPPSLSADTVADFISALQTIHSDTASVTGPIPHTFRFLDSQIAPHVLSITFTSANPLTHLRNHPTLTAFESAHSLEITLQPSHTHSATKRLAVFDMDSTLIQQEVIDLLAAHAGAEEAVSNITSRAMNGELDFSASLRERVGLLAGLPASTFEALKPSLTLTPGAHTLLKCLKKMGVKTALLSGGFTPLARYIASILGIDHVHANDIAIDDATDTFTGVLHNSNVIVDGARKKLLLESIASDMDIEDAAAIVAVGDGANDLPMLWAAGLGVAVNAKPRVQVAAPARLNGEMALLEVLFLMGLTDEEIELLSR